MTRRSYRLQLGGSNNACALAIDLRMEKGTTLLGSFAYLSSGDHRSTAALPMALPDG